MRKKKILILWMVVALLTLQLQVCAAKQRSIDFSPNLSFNGTTANCSVTVMGDNRSDEIVAVMKLWDSGTCLKTWRDTGEGSVKLSETYGVSKGKTYKLTVDATINGLVQPTASVTKTCN